MWSRGRAPNSGSAACAQRAGVGPGTLYRNFPTKEALVVYQHEVDRLVESVPQLPATRPPLEALRHWTVDLVAAMRKRHGLGDALSSDAHQAIAEHTYGPVIAAITRLLEAFAGCRLFTVVEAFARDRKTRRRSGVVPGPRLRRCSRRATGSSST